MRVTLLATLLAPLMLTGARARTRPIACAVPHCP